MAYTVKNKIRYGTVFLFFLLLVLGGVSIFHIVRLQRDSKIILKNNYESLDYARQMLAALDSIPFNRGLYSQTFERALTAQENNITEKGERDAADGIKRYYEQFQNGDSTPATLQHIRNNIYQVIAVNMSAIEGKNNTAGKTANKAVAYITLIAAVVFIVGLTFTFNFPSVITDPINALTKALAEVTGKNYKHRIHLDRKDEFGQMATAFNAMAERLEYFENSNLNKIIFEKTRAEAVINSLKDASIGIDKNDRVLFANDQALQLLGLKAEDIVGKAVNDVSKRNDLLRFLLEEKNNMPFKIVVENRENYFIKEVVDITREESSSRVIVLKNITSFKELDAAKNNFIATVSHELKTPLASSDFSLKLLTDERVTQLTPEQHELVDNLKRDNERMLKILSELLNIAQVESGRMQLDIQRVQPGQIANNAISAVANAAKEKSISINKINTTETGSIMADADKASWVLNNLLTNAVKYSQNNAVITLNIYKEDQYCIFSVSDTGSGILPEYQAKVFDRFFKVPGSASSGTGLGLSISKEFIEAQHGKIWMESQPGVGSTFSFSLPVA